MANSVYQINKGINQSIEFKGLKAQYIWYLGGGLVVLLVVFAILYVIGLPSLLCVGIIVAAAAVLIIQVYGMSGKYGEHGLMKALARKQVPRYIRCNSRKIFLKALKRESRN